jgi:hypothetical protein
MNHVIITKRGDRYVIGESTAKALVSQLLKNGDERPQFVNIKSLNLTVNTDSIASVEKEAKSIFST